MKFNVAGATDVGLVRSNNEDFFLIDQKNGLFIVADGMGGYQKGELASKMTCEYVSFHVKSFFSGKKKRAIEGADLKKAVQLANDKIREKIQSSPDLDKMGSTVVGFLMKDDGLLVLNVGDSRCYRYRKNRLEQVTVDHSLVQETKAAGIKRELPSQFRNIVTRAVGMKDKVETDIFIRSAKEGDKFLLSSDGLHGFTSDEKIAAVLARDETPEEEADSLIELAKQGGGKDNITCIVMHVYENIGSSDNEATQTLSLPTLSGEGNSFVLKVVLVLIFVLILIILALYVPQLQELIIPWMQKIRI